MSGYSMEYRKQHEAEVKAAEDEQKARERENAAIRQRRLQALETERRAQQDKREAAIEEQLQPAKVRLQREWLVAHPGTTPADFEESA